MFVDVNSYSKRAKIYFFSLNRFFFVFLPEIITQKYNDKH